MGSPPLIGAMLHVPIEARTGAPVSLPFRLHEVVSRLHPDGWKARYRDWDKLSNRLAARTHAVHARRQHLAGMVSVVQATVIPTAWNPDAAALFTVTIPAATAHGARIDWPRLVHYGKDSAVLYRAYLSVLRAARQLGTPTDTRSRARLPRRCLTPTASRYGAMVRATPTRRLPTRRRATSAHSQTMRSWRRSASIRRTATTDTRPARRSIGWPPMVLSSWNDRHAGVRIFGPTPGPRHLTGSAT